MALVNRQNNLFAAEDWKVAYKAFSEVNFQAYDFDTIRAALVEYVRVNYPETFNDYTESSEFIAIIELLAYLSQTLTFRMDLNSRENFLETAERRDSVFKLARQLGYNPRRNIPASGLMKVVAINTNEPLRDSLGNDINNTNIFWDDANNPDAYEQFITILNAAMNSANRFSTPTKSGTVGGIATDLYELNTPITSPVAYDFDTTVAGTKRSFQVVNPTIKEGTLGELHPDRLNNFNIVYRNDGTGISSGNSGFFVMFKQGRLQSSDYNYTDPLQSRTQDISIPDINETDVFVQEIDGNGATIAKWTQIPNTVGQTLNYNDLAFGVRTLYSVENLNNAGIKLRFPDGNFGDIPFGTFRTYYRTSDPETFAIAPEDARNIKVVIPYENAEGVIYNLTVTFSLQQTVNNSLAPETLTAIKQRAPQVYYTQNRMVSAQDYNVFPFSQTTNIVKLKAINKTHAGHSRFIDINDPTGTYQNLETFANDGSLYIEDVPGTAGITISDDNPVAAVVNFTIPLILKDRNLNNFIYEQFRDSSELYDINRYSLASKNAIWKSLPVVLGTSATGYFHETVSTGDSSVEVLDTSYSDNGTKIFAMFTENNFIKFADPDDASKYAWARITGVANNGTLHSGLTTATGPFSLSAPIQDGWKAVEYIATMRKIIQPAEITSISTEMNNKRTFGLGFDTDKDTWYVIDNADLDKKSDWALNNAGNKGGTGSDASWLLLFNYSAIDSKSYKYAVTMRGQQYVVQSKNDLKFYNINNVKVADSNNQSSRDVIQFTTLNYKPGSAESFLWTPTAGTVGSVWVSDETGAQYTPSSYDPGIPLRTRSTTWHDVEVKYLTSGGIYRDGNFASNVFVNSATVSLNTHYDVAGIGNSTTANVTIANNSGRINSLPSNITIPFSNTTFGFNIINASEEVVYRDYNTTTNMFETYRATTTGTTSFGVNNAADTGQAGRILLANANVAAQTGNLVITNMFSNNYTHAFDSTGQATQDRVVVNYKQSKEQLASSVDWNVVAPVKYDDGYTDNRKVVVSPIDTDGDLVPNRPLQFREFVNNGDLVFFEYYTDYDGYSYTRPLAGNIVDYRNEQTITADFSANTLTNGDAQKIETLSTTDILIVKNISQVPESVTGTLGEAAITNSNGLVIYDNTAKKMYQMIFNSNGSAVLPVETTDYYVRNGRSAGQNTALIENDEIIIKWKHVAPKDVRIDPSISNVVEMLVLTNNYFDEIKKYKKVPGTEFPLSPTPAQLSTEFAKLNEFKSASDTLVYKSAEFKLLFGTDAETNDQAKFRIVKLAGSTMSDNEIKSKVIEAFNTFFAIENWEFGETFYFTELSSYVHQRLGSNIGSIVIIPKNSAGSFGDLFQIKAEPHEMFLNTAKVSDIEIVEKINSQTLRADR
jgi:hypothetical protein